VPHRRAAAVIRFSSLGDLLLAAHVPVFLKREDPARRLLFLTKERYADLLRGHPDIDRVYALSEGRGGTMASGAVTGSLGDLLAAMRGDGVEEIVDLHRNWRSARVRAAFPGARIRLAAKYALRRRLWVYARWLRPRPVPPMLRTYRELAGLDPASPLTPWLLGALSDTERSRGLERVGSGSRARGFVLLGAGARWGTKRWPAAHFVRLAERIEEERGHRARFALLPGEPVAPEIERHLAARGEAPLSLPFRELAAVASHALAIVSNDSAVLHLGPALGVPAVGIFGGTVPEFGFARQGPRDEVAEIELGCRPCGVHGRSRCPLGHHACMRDLAPDLAHAALSRALARA
jgi:heptosyltransferase-2